MAEHGIDVSEWQGDIDWNRVKTDFAIIRAGYGRLAVQRDKRFEENYSGCEAAGIPKGAYWYSYAESSADAVREAEAFLEVVKGKKFEYPLYYDVEERSILALGRERVSGIVSAFAERLEAAGYFVGLYMSESALTAYTTPDIRRRYALWIASYGVTRPNYSGIYGMWQSSATGRVDGITGDVDLDEAYEDYPEIVRTMGFNGYSKEKTHRLTVIIDGETVIDNYGF